EEVEGEAASEARLVDVDQQRVHLALVGQLLQERAEGLLDLHALLLVGLEVHRELLLLEEGVLLLVDVLAALLDLLGLPLPEEEVGGDLDRQEDREEGAGLDRPWPVARLLRVELPQIVEHAHFFTAAFLAPATASSGWARLIEMFMLNSFTRLPDLSGAGTALISTSSGFSRYGEAPRLRMSVETRAFDCAYPMMLTFA